jgi:hypothetical protein
MPWNMPLNDIRNYLGEKITLYFAFVSQAVVSGVWYGQ